MFIILIHYFSAIGYIPYKLNLQKNEKSCAFEHCFHPHDFDDRVFVIYQHDKLPQTRGRSSFKPILQWLAIVFFASIILFALRYITKWRQRRTSQNSAGIVEHYLITFVDSQAVFLGNALPTFGGGSVERWFLVSFSIFGMILKAIYTDSLFVMFTEANYGRFTTVDQLLESGIKILRDINMIATHEEFS